MSQTRTKSQIIVKEGFHHFGKDYVRGEKFEITDVADWPEGCFENRLKHDFLGFTTTLVEALTAAAEKKASLEDMTKADLVTYAKDTLNAEVDANLSKPAMIEQIKKLEKAAAGS